MEANGIQLPSSGGSYTLFLRLSQSRCLGIGRLGDFTLPPGMYVYLGSAHGPGGLQARISRHLRGDGTPHWHVDTLRNAATVKGYAYLLNRQVGLLPKRVIPLECLWSQALDDLPGAVIPVPGFGASDCGAGCPAHLIAFPKAESWPNQKKRIINRLAEVLGIPPDQVEAKEV